ncbi:MAG TPA: hypothetical protein VK524_17065 [Polyangiaceae bacterium]|nr:hypothetical protein [Polyangiaceae bacterium]
MSRAFDIIGIGLLLCGISALAAAIYTLGNGRDLAALYWMLVGALVLRTGSNLVRPKTR